MCYFAKGLTFLYVAVVGLMLLPQPAWADSKKDNCDAEGGTLSRDHRQSPNLSNWAIANSFRAAYLAWDIESGLEIGIETELLDERLSASIYFYDGTQKNVVLTSANDADMEVFVDEQKSQGIGFEVIGEITPGWDFIVYYAYTDARLTKLKHFGVGRQVPDVAIHSGCFWTTYEIQAGSLQGLGFGSGVRFIGDRPGDIDNTFKLPSYWQTDVAIFYHRNNWKAALSIENLFNVETLTAHP